MLLLRHGESTWNAQHRWQGQSDPPLSELGMQQAQHAAASLGRVDAIYCSPLQRANQTAAILAATLGVGPVEVVFDLRERNAGEWTGLTRQEIEAGWPGYLRSGRRPAGYEMEDDLITRVRPALEAIAGRHEPAQELLVVTHAGVIHAVEAILGIDEWVRLANLGGRRVVIDGPAWALGARTSLLEGPEVTVPAEDV